MHMDTSTTTGLLERKCLIHTWTRALPYEREYTHMDVSNDTGLGPFHTRGDIHTWM